jgi:hypothetical protein
MRVAFAIDEMGQASEIGQMLQVAIATCRRNTSFQPIVLSTGFLPAFRSWLDANNVECASVDTPMASAIVNENRKNGYPLQAIGNYLRYEACSILDEECFLYTDCDVLFLADPVMPSTPTLFAAGPEDSPFRFDRVNSGVLLINRPALRAELPGFYEFSKNNLGRLYPGFDQAAVNEYFADRIDRLPLELNWRPYWGTKEGIAIVHFHGVKASVAEGILDGINLEREDRKDLVLDIMSKTLNNLDFFVKLIGQDDLEKLPYGKSLMALLARAEAIKRDPLGSYCRSVTAVRETMEKKASEDRLRLHRIAVRAVETSMCRNALVEIGDAYKVRLTIPTNQDVFGIADLVDEGGAIIARFRNATTANVRRIDTDTSEQWELSTIEPIDEMHLMDVIFNLPAVQAGESRRVWIRLMAASEAKIKIYLGRDMLFSEGWAVEITVV